MPTTTATSVAVATEGGGAPATTTKETSTFQHSKTGKWEVDNIDRFLLQLYHRNIVSQHSDWMVLKSCLRQEFQKFLGTLENTNLSKKFMAVSCNPESLLLRSHLIRNTQQRGYFRIQNIPLFKYRNKIMAKFDERRKKGELEYEPYKMNAAIDADVIAATTNTGDGLDGVDPALAVLFQVDENSLTYVLEYQATERQSIQTDFFLTSLGCFICQCNFISISLYEKHMEYHGDDSDFESLKSLKKSESPIFKLSYSLCKKSHYFCFTLETDLSNLIIDKIIIVQSRSMYYVHNSRVPYEMPVNGRQNFFVDSHLFSIHLEKPIVVICHERGNKEMRIMEQHHIMSMEAFPVVQFGINPRHMPKKKIFKEIFKLPQYFPTKVMRTALKQEFIMEPMMEMSNDFKDYISQGKVFTQQNFRQAMNMLLQVEDLDGIREYFGLTQWCVKLNKRHNDYSLKLQSDNRIYIENILSPFDEVLIITDNNRSITLNDDSIMDLILMNSDDFKRKKKTYFGSVESISNGRVTFVCYQKIPIENMFVIIFRPNRLILRYQYHALKLFDQMSSSDKKRFLFPDEVNQCKLPTTSLVLHNQSILKNPEQLEAVRNIAEGPRSEATYIIFGPPGTGKTTTLVEAIVQLYMRRCQTKIIVTAGSNSACDEIALRLCKIFDTIDDPRAIVRIYARSNEKRSSNIDEMLLECSNMYDTQFYPDIQLLHEYRVVVCTLNVIGKLATGKFGQNACGKGIYTHVFVDEVAASTEAEVLVGIMNTLSSQSSLILAGDYKQLGPILQSSRAEKLGLGVSLMDRLLTRDCYRVDKDGNYDHTIQTRLRRNYRSHPEIVKLYSQMYYNNELMALANGDDLSLVWHRSPNPKYPIIFHSVFGTVKAEQTSVSLYNQKELEVVMDYVKDLMYFGVNGQKITQTDIGIISPYKKQYLRIQEELNLRNWFQIETGSVETFQGKEKLIIIVSFVRSFTPTLGFLGNPRRLNVTLSRPKSLLILIGNPKTLSFNYDFKCIIETCSHHKTMVGNNKNPSTSKLQNLSKSMQKLNLKETSRSLTSNTTKPLAKMKKWPQKKNKQNAVAAVATAIKNDNNSVSSSSTGSDTKVDSNVQPRLEQSIYKRKLWWLKEQETLRLKLNDYFKNFKQTCTHHKTIVSNNKNSPTTKLQNLTKSVRKLNLKETPSNATTNTTKPKLWWLKEHEKLNHKLNDYFKNIKQTSTHHKTIVSNKKTSLQNLSNSMRKLNLEETPSNATTNTTKPVVPKKKKKKKKKTSRNKMKNTVAAVSNTATAKINDNKVDSEAQPQLGHSINKHVKSTSQQKPENNFLDLLLPMVPITQNQHEAALPENQNTTKIR